MIRFLLAFVLAFAAAGLLFTTPGSSIAGVLMLMAAFVLLISSFAHPARALRRGRA